MTNTPISGTFYRWASILAVMILLVLIMSRTGADLVYNYRLKSAFKASITPSPYQLGIPMDEMDLTVYSPYLPLDMALPSYPWTSRVVTPVTIRYYSGIPDRGTAPALEIKKGTKIIALPEDSEGSPLHKAGYGYTSYPSYERGWRYVRPFQLADGERLPSSDQYYYVRIEDLKAVIGEVIKVNPIILADARRSGGNVETVKHNFATYLDKSLYWHGACLSPDLFHQVFDRWNVYMTATAGVLILLMLIGRRTGF